MGTPSKRAANSGQVSGKGQNFTKIAEDCTPIARKVRKFREDFPKVAKIAKIARARRRATFGPVSPSAPLTAGRLEIQRRS
jgi:hypothetical protein